MRQHNDSIIEETLGICPVSLTEFKGNNIAFAGTIPYVAYTDADHNHRVNVKKFNTLTNSWELVGEANFSGQNSGYTDIAFKGNVPYVVYADGGDSGRIKVKKLHGNTWQIVGNADFSGNHSSCSYITFNHDDAYIVYGGNFNKITVRKYNPATNRWERIGEALTSGYISSKLIFINNIPYLSYTERNKEHTSIIKKFNGNCWETVGEACVQPSPTPSA